MTKTAGLLFFLAGTLLVLGILLAEIFYPASYSQSQNMISNLGSTPPPLSIIFEPSAGIFDLALIIGGLLTIVGGFILKKTVKSKLLIISIILMGVGAAGVGIFPAFHPLAHPVAALLTFASGGIAAILSSKITKPPFSFVGVVLGGITLLFLFGSLLFPDAFVPIFGKGGAERLVAYPAILWLIGFGGYLQGASSKV